MEHMTPLEVISRYPQHDYTLKSLFETRTRANPSRPFLVFRDKTWTWGEFNEAIDGAARMLASRGIRKGDRLGIMAANSDAHVLLLFAAARIGAITVPVNPEFGVPEAGYVLTHAGVSAVACSTETLQVAREASREIDPQPWFALVDGEASGTPRLADLVKNGGRARLPDRSRADDTFAIIYTSGTTGFPKGVMHSQRNFALAGERHVARVHLQPDDRTLCILPMFHVNALFNVLASTVAAGARLIIAPRFSASRFWRLAADTGATHVNVMMAVSAILARRPRSEFVPGHRLRVVNGSGFTQETMDAYMREFGVAKVIEGLGMTEIPGAFSNPYDGPHELGSMGKPGVHPDPSRKWTEARILDEHGRDVPDDAVGELAVRIPTLMQGYYRDPEQTAASFRDGWFLTGDLVRRDKDGYFFFVARKKDIIRRRGENVAGAELDRVIAEHPGVSEVAAIAVDSELGEDEIMAVVVPKARAALQPEDIRNWCAERLAAHKVPRFVVFAERLPHTPTHKVAKHMLKKDPTLRARAVDFQAARS
ncbi:MAG: AMP-binding protein [Betaproteobacteria bacterium]|nr:AMP-binding protein [Betaproteobacteria bacterium]